MTMPPGLTPRTRPSITYPPTVLPRLPPKLRLKHQQKPRQRHPLLLNPRLHLQFRRANPVMPTETGRLTVLITWSGFHTTDKHQITARLTATLIPTVL